MKKIITTVFLATTCGLGAQADEPAMTTTTNQIPQKNNYDYSSGDRAGKLGVGILAGEPTGASVKFFLTDAIALDGAIGWSTHDDTDLYLHSDLLWHNYDLIPVPRGQMGVYLGAGGLLRVRDQRENQAGIRLPLGISYMFDNAPVELFGEIAPTLDVTPDTRGEVTGGVGMRFWF